MHAIAAPFVLLLLVGAVAISRLNARIDAVPNLITEDLAFSPVERTLFVNDFERLRLGLQVGAHLFSCGSTSYSVPQLTQRGTSDFWLPDHESTHCSDVWFTHSEQLREGPALTSPCFCLSSLASLCCTFGRN